MALKQWISICSILTTCITNAYGYTVVSERYSYYLLDGSGQIELSGAIPVQGEGTYSIPVHIIPENTAIIVMDPWIDMPSDTLNAYHREITANRIVPLVRRTREIGHYIIILTNDPTETPYNTQIDRLLAEMVDGQKVHLLYHQNFNDKSFANWLRNKSIDTLIYSGFSSNQCVIGRQTGMIMMAQHGFRLFFIPEASAAIEMAGTWKNQMLHRATTIIISQWIGAVVHWKDIMQAMSN